MSHQDLWRGGARVMVSYATFNNISPLSAIFVLVLQNCPIRTKNIFDAVFLLAFDEYKQKFYDRKARMQSPDM